MNKNCFIEKMRENYMNVYLLAIVPILGSSSTLLSALTMAMVLSFVLFFSNLIFLALKKRIPENYRGITSIVISAFVTTISAVLLQLVNLDLYSSISSYIPLVIFSYVIIETLNETQELQTKQSIDNVLYKMISLIFILAFIGLVREFFGLGEILGYKVVDYGIPKILVIQTPAGAFFLLSFIAFVSNWIRGEK